MIKNIFLVGFFFWFGAIFSQTTISYTQDLGENFSSETIKNANFKEFKSIINKGFNNGVYWFKIEGIKEKTAIQFTNNHLSEGIGFYNNKEILPEKNERFLTFIIKKSPAYIKLNITKEAYIPITLKAYDAYQYSEKKEHLYAGFYYGFAFIVVLINLFYYINFKETTFLYYALFLMTISFGLFMSDGILHFFKFPEKVIDALEVIDHCFVVLFSVLFANSYLQISEYYSKSKYISYTFLVLVYVFGILYFISGNFLFFIFMESLVFLTFIYLWSLGVSLFSKNIFIKIFVFAYAFILILGILFYITKLYGLPKISAAQLKVGGFFEMILLSFAVIYRMKILQEENIQIREEITNYATKISSLSEELKKNKKGEINYFTDFNLSEREQEIFTFLSQGKSNKEIAEALFISVNTVKYHIKKIYSKLNIKNREEVKKIITH